MHEGPHKKVLDHMEAFQFEQAMRAAGHATLSDVINALRHYRAAQSVVTAWDEWDKDQQETGNICDFTRHALISVAMFYGIYAQFLFDYQSAHLVMLAAWNSPEMLKTNIDVALNDGYSDASERWMEKLGMRVLNKNAQAVTVNVSAVAQAAAVESARSLGLPSLEDDMNEDSEDIRHVLSLPESTAIPIDIEIEEQVPIEQ